MLRKILGITLVLFSVPAFAADLSYNYFQLGYQSVDLDDDFLSGFDTDGDGFALGGSFEINESWFIGVDYSSVDFDFGIDLDQYSIGAGWHTELTDNADFYAMVSYVSAEVSASGFGDADEDGIGAKIGMRGMIGEQFELGGSLSYVDLGDAGDGTAIGGHAIYNFTPNVGAGVTIELDDDVTAYGVGVRLYFGN